MSDQTKSKVIVGLTRGETAHRLRLSPERVAQLASSGVLTFTKTPLGRLFDVDSVEALVAARARREVRGDDA